MGEDMSPREDRQRAFAERITRAFPDVRIATMREMPHVGWGGDSDVWLVNEALIMRFPRTTEMAIQLGVEACLLPRMAPALPLPVPAFSHVARDAATGQPQCAGYPLIPGEPMTPELLDELELDEAARAALAGVMGGFLARLHAFPLAQARACGVAEGMREPEHTRTLYERVREHAYPLLTPAMRVWSDHLFGDALARRDQWEYQPALVHGDLSSDHMLFDRATRAITGIIDFGDMAIGDPAGDFVGLAPYGAAFVAGALADSVGALGALAAERLTFYRKRLPFIALAWGAEHGDEEALAEGMARLRAVVAGA